MHSKRTESQPWFIAQLRANLQAFTEAIGPQACEPSSSDHSTSLSVRPNYRPFGHAFDWLTLTSASFQHQSGKHGASAFLTPQSRFLRRQQCTEVEDDHSGKGGGLTATST